jgi:hypothetical protein
VPGSGTGGVPGIGGETVAGGGCAFRDHLAKALAD